jgi:AraC-like DNA-binding protein
VAVQPHPFVAEVPARTRVLRGFDGEQPWELWQRTPPAPMSGLVAGIWAGTSPHAFEGHRTLPNGELMLMLHLGPTQRLVELDGQPCQVSLGGGFLAGLQERPATFETLEANTCVAAVRLLPLGGWLLLGGLPQTELLGRVIEVEAALGGRSGVAALRQRMGNAADLGAALDEIEAWLLERFARARTPHPATRAAGGLLRAARGTLRVEGVADATGVSRRRLHELFLREVGVSPKRLARILRFREALERLATAPAVDLTRLALDCGYYDQAHLYRDFRDLVGMTPLEYLVALGAGLDGPDVLHV